MNFVSFEQMVELYEGGRVKTNKQKEVTDVDFSSLPWEQSTLVVLKDQHELLQKFILGEVLAFPITNFGPFEGDLKERETGLNSGTCLRAREKRRPGVKSILFKADSNFFSDWMQGNTNPLLYLHAFGGRWWRSSLHWSKGHFDSKTRADKGGFLLATQALHSAN